MSDEYDFEDDVSLDNDEKNAAGGRQEWLKLSQKGQTVRCGLVYFHTFDQNAVKAATKEAKHKLTPEERAPVVQAALQKRATELNKKPEQLTLTEKLDVSVAHFKLWSAHYSEGVGYVISRLGKDGAEADQVWKRLGEVKKHFSTLLLVYPTDHEGNINMNEFATQVKKRSLRFVPWRFSPRVYEEIFNLNAGLKSNKLALAAQDLKLECKEPQFQNIGVQFGGASTWQKNDAIREVVLSGALSYYDKLNPFREMTTDAVREKLGISLAQAEDVSSSDNFQDLLNSV